MKLRVTIAPDGTTLVESISLLEDVWHDFRYFKLRAAALDQGAVSPTDRLVAKRYRRAALLSLLCYFEGVVNHWLELLLPAREWRRISRSLEPLKAKVNRIQSRLPGKAGAFPDIEGAKALRNMLVHLKPGGDGHLYDGITADLLEEAEKRISLWLRTVEVALHLSRHPDTRHESRALRDSLGTTTQDAEGYTGDLGSDIRISAETGSSTIEDTNHGR